MKYLIEIGNMMLITAFRNNEQLYRTLLFLAPEPQITQATMHIYFFNPTKNPEYSLTVEFRMAMEKGGGLQFETDSEEYLSTMAMNQEIMTIYRYLLLAFP